MTTENSMEGTILIAGDFCPDDTITNLLISGDLHSVFHDVLDDIQNADVALLNLECPLSLNPAPILKTGPHLYGDPRILPAVHAAGFDVVNLANNHIRDIGDNAVMETITAVKEAGLHPLGAGECIEKAARPYLTQVGDLRVCIYSMAESEFNTAKNGRPGSNNCCPMDYIRFLNTYENQYDYLIVLYHGGVEHNPLPTPQQQNLCRFLVEEGADIVICQHSHCLGQMESYRDKKILYGQGNFLFPKNGNLPDEWKFGCLVKISFGNRCSTQKIDLIWTEQSHNSDGVKKISDQNLEVDLENKVFHNENCKNSDIVQSNWEHYTDKKNKSILMMVFLNYRLFRILANRFGFMWWKPSRKRMTILANLIRCESHRETVLSVLEKNIESK